MSDKPSIKGGRGSQTFMLGAVILMISNVLVKLIGALFKIPLQHLIMEEGMAYFQAAYNIYVSFYMISTAGIPVAISRMIATSNSHGNHREVNRIFRISYWVFFAVGAAATIIMISCAKFFAETAALDGSEYAMIAIAPTLFFICISSAYRGYFQGLQNMTPTAVSQVIESVGKLSIGLIAGWYFLKRGYPMDIVAAFVIVGVTIGVIAATVYIVIFKHMFFQAQLEADQPKMAVRSTKDLLYELVVISIPISLASSIMGLTNVVDTMLVTRRLTETAVSGGMLYETAKDIAKKSYGAYAMPQTLFNMPTTLIYPFAISALPALSKYYSSGDSERSKKLMESTFRVSSIVALPCALGMSAMARPIISLIYPNNAITDTVSNIDLAAPCLTVLGLSVFFLGMISVTNSVLQAYHLQNLTIVSTVCGILIKALSTYILLGIPSVGLTGAAVGTALCYLTIMIFNIFFIACKIHFFPSIRRTFLKPLISAAVCIVPCICIYRLMRGVFGDKLVTLISIAVAAVIYVLLLLILKGISEDDIKMLPKSEKIIKILKKAGLLGD